MSCRSINVTGAFTFLVFFGILFRRGTDLGQEFSDMKYVFLFIVLFVSLLLIYYFTELIFTLHVTLTLYAGVASIAWC